MKLPAWLLAAGLAGHNPLPQDPAEAPPEALVSPYTGAFVAAPVQIWKIPLPGDRVNAAVHTEAGGPLLHGPYIYTGSAAEDALLVLRRDDGALVRRLPARGPVQSEPVIVGGRLYFGDVGGSAWAYALKAGIPAEEPLWTYEGSSPILAPPTVAGPHVYIADVSNVVVAVDRDSGELQWRHAQKLDPGRTAELELYGHPRPVLAGGSAEDRGVLLTGFSDGTLAALDPDRGEILWQRRVGEGQYPDIVAEPLVLGGDAVVAGFTAPLLGLDLGTRNVRWRLDIGGANGAIAGGGPGPGIGERPSALEVPDRFVFHGGVDGVLRAIDTVTGAMIWEWDSETGSALTQPIYTEAGIVVGASGGSLYIIDPATGRRRWEWLPGYHVSGITAQPALEGRQLVAVTNAGEIVSFVVPEDRIPRERNPLLEMLKL